MPEAQVVGKVKDYYSHLGVAVVDLSKLLRVGDRIKIKGGKTEFEQPVESMQIEHKPVTEAKEGDSIGLKVEQKVRKGYKIYIM